MMKMFTRDAVLMGPPAQVGAWTTDVAAAYERATGRSVGVWHGIAGGMTGHVTWSLPTTGLAEMLELDEQAMSDDDWLAAVEEGRQFFTGPMHDTLYRPYGGAAFEPEAGEPGNVAAVTTATAAAGSLGDAVGWGLEAAEYVGNLTGVPTMLLGNEAGRFSRLTWMAVAADAAAADEAQDAMFADDGYRKLVARGGQHFVSGSGRTQMFLRVA